MCSGPPTVELLTHADNHIQRMLLAQWSDEQIVDALFWSALSRPPTHAEMSAARFHFSEADNRRDAVEDVCWALMNSREFQLRL